MNYYALQVTTGREHQFIENMKKLNPALAEAYPIIYITRELRIRRRGKYLTECQPLFSSYLFVQCEEPLSGDTIHAFKQLPDFYHFLKSNTEVTPLSASDVAILQHFLSLGPKVGASLVSFDENDRIVVHRGPLKGIEGSIIKVDRRKKRAKIRLNFENSPLTIDLSFDVMEKETNI